MILVYLSLALIVAALIGFSVSFLRTAKRMSGTLERISVTGEKIRRQSERINDEKNLLTQNFSSLQMDFFHKKEKVQNAAKSAQQVVHTVQGNIHKSITVIRAEKS
ncbi:hypothetical protein [Sporolactobacillus vineae]|uniref:hypothetical protein n=1 Tax=Sporolactobacillus vineae TaxID=444463 RepID=UPI0002893C3D|nr:hypothetical protein [Sporolactobacillus vineae]